MPERRSSRSLRDVSHLFLSESRPLRDEARRGTACVWLAVADASLNRAHFAVGLAAAFTRQGMGVSLLEVCGNLPAIGYYFGMEKAEYLAPALDRAALVSGEWSGAVRYCFSASVSSFRGYVGTEPDRAAPHAIVVAFPYPRRRNAASFLSALRGASAVLAGEEAPDGCPPDAIIVAGGAEGAKRIGACAAGMREAFPPRRRFLRGGSLRARGRRVRADRPPGRYAPIVGAANAACRSVVRRSRLRSAAGREPEAKRDGEPCGEGIGRIRGECVCSPSESGSGRARRAVSLSGSAAR